MAAALPTDALTLAPTAQKTTLSTTRRPPSPPPTTTTTTTIMTTELSSASPVTPESSNACVIASSLSAAVVILFLLIAFGVIYFLRKRKKGKSIRVSNEQSTDVPKLPRKNQDKKENQPFSPYHGPLRTQEDYSVPPPTREATSIKPPLPPNLARKMQQDTETGNAYYLDMVGITDGVYQNIGTAQDNIYMNN